MRAMVFLTQGVFFNFFFAAYLVSPKYCHRLVGYLEEEAVRTYTHILQSIESGELKGWATQPAPEIAKKYWSLGEKATMKDVMLVIRADEAHHRVSHKAQHAPCSTKQYRSSGIPSHVPFFSSAFALVYFL